MWGIKDEEGLTHLLSGAMSDLPERMREKLANTNTKIYTSNKVDIGGVFEEIPNLSAVTGYTVPKLEYHGLEISIILPTYWEKYSDRFMREVLTHELVHAKQLHSGELEITTAKSSSDHIVKHWNGKEHYVDGSLKDELELPWEKEAHSISSPKMSIWESIKIGWWKGLTKRKRQYNINISLVAVCVKDPIK